MSDDPDHDHDRDHANDNGDHDKLGGKQVAPAPTGGALAALAKLQTDLAKVNTAAIIGRSGLPMLLFKSRDNGTWGFGQKRTIPEPGSRWAINPLTFKRGYICFNNNKPAGEQLLSVSEPEVDVTKLPNTGFEWQPEWAVNMKCLDGADAGIEVIYDDRNMQTGFQFKDADLMGMPMRIAVSPKTLERDVCEFQSRDQRSPREELPLKGIVQELQRRIAAELDRYKL